MHDENEHIPKFIIEDMLNYDKKPLDEWSDGLDRIYSRFCSNFDRFLI